MMKVAQYESPKNDICKYTIQVCFTEKYLLIVDDCDQHKIDYDGFTILPESVLLIDSSSSIFEGKFVLTILFE
jgi:hypothetical protein